MISSGAFFVVELAMRHGPCGWLVLRNIVRLSIGVPFFSAPLDSFSYPGKKKSLVKPKTDLVFFWSPGIEKDRLAR